MALDRKLRKRVFKKYALIRNLLMMDLDIDSNHALAKWTNVWLNGRNVSKITRKARVPRYRFFPWIGEVKTYTKENGKYVIEGNCGDRHVKLTVKRGIVWWGWAP